MLLLHLFFQTLQNIRGGVDANIPHDQDFFQFFIKFIVNSRKTIKDRINPIYNIISCFIQPFLQSGKKTFFFSGILHIPRVFVFGGILVFRRIFVFHAHIHSPSPFSSSIKVNSLSLSQSG